MNVGRSFAGEEIKLGNDFAMFLVPEAFRDDFNGDGDTDDLTLQSFDFARAQPTDMGVALPFGSGQHFKVHGDHAAFVARERETGRSDLNGDGDTSDDVAHVFDASSGIVHNLGIACAVSQFQLGDDLAAFQVSEARQGSTDLNGDGDAFDQVLFVHDFRTGRTTNVGVAISLFSIFAFEPLNLIVGDSLVLFGAFEAGQGQDLNGDGDLDDTILHAYSAKDGNTSNLGLQFWEARYADGLFALAIGEADSGAADLNGDGDANDHVLFVLDPVTGTLSNLGFAIRERFGLHDMRIAGGLLPFLASEVDADTDFNQDGDAFDRVMHVYDHLTGVVTNTELATPLQSDAGGAQFVVARPFVAFQVSEGAQQVHLNDDGDLIDKVAFLYDCRDGSLTSLGMAMPFRNEMTLGVTPEILGFLVGEQEQGADLDGDGTLDDQVLFVRDAKSGRTKNTRISVWSGMFGDGVGLRVHGSRIAYETREAELGRDANEDGDLEDIVLRLLDVSTNRTIAIDLASLEFGIWDFQFDGRRLVFPVSESQQGATDLNGDGDQSDYVVHITRL